MNNYLNPQRVLETVHCIKWMFSSNLLSDNENYGECVNNCVKAVTDLL